MDSARTTLVVALLAVVVGYAVLSSVWVSADPGWYPRLTKPSFQPPDVVFGVIWPLNFVALGVVGVLFVRAAPVPRAWTFLAVFAASVVMALAWAYLFYVPHQLGAAAACLTVAAALTWGLVGLAFAERTAYGLGLVVYAAWLSVATALAWAYWRLN